MKTNKLFFLGVLGLMSFLSNAQVVNQSNSNGTSVGSGAGTSTVASGATYYGYQAGNASSTTTANLQNTFVGSQAGKNVTTGTNNSSFGYGAGASATTGTNNASFGYVTGSYVTTGSRNSCFGANAGPYTNGSDNVCVGSQTLNYNTTTLTSKSTAIGSLAGVYGYGTENIFIGYQAGAYKTGSNNVFIGNNVGESSSNKLNIDNAATTTPLIWGDFSARTAKLNAKVGIGAVTTFPTTAGSVNVSAYNLFVTGGILTEEVRVNLRNGSGLWADYVFNKDYDLKPLSEVEKYIADNGHLQNVPSAKQVKEDGIELGEMAKIQQEKIEELTLYLIQQNKAIEELKAQVKALSERK